MPKLGSVSHREASLAAWSCELKVLQDANRSRGSEGLN